MIQMTKPAREACTRRETGKKKKIHQITHLSRTRTGHRAKLEQPSSRTSCDITQKHAVSVFATVLVQLVPQLGGEFRQRVCEFAVSATAAAARDKSAKQANTGRRTRYSAPYGPDQCGLCSRMREADLTAFMETHSC